MRAWGGALVAVMLVAGCAEDTVVDGRFRQSEWDYLQTFLRTTRDPPDEARARFGRVLFFDTSYSGTASATMPRPEVSCATCHKPPWFVDPHPQSEGDPGKWTKRNTMTLVDLAYHEGGFTWDGRVGTAGAVLDVPLLGPMESTEADLASAIAARYRTQYEALYGPVPETVPGTIDADTMCLNLEDALEQYEVALTTGRAPFDNYLLGDFTQLSESAKRGLELFIGDALCSECHSGESFTDARYRNTGVPQFGDHAAVEDRGRGGITDPCAGIDDCDADALVGAFRTPTLRNVAMTQPYMHAGQFETLSDVVDFYWRGGDDHGFVGTKDRMIHALPELTEQDRADLVAFLESLTSQPVDEDWYR